MLRVVLNTNIIVSGLIASSGNPREILAAWRQGVIILLVSDAIVGEVIDVLGRPFFRDRRRITSEDVAGIRQALQTDSVRVTPRAHVEMIKDDPDDDRILECALEGGADYLISSDHHLLDLERYRGTRIVTAREFTAILKTQNAGYESV